MITRCEDMRVEMRDRLRGGEGTVKFVHLLDKERTFGKVNLAALLHIQPGQSIGLHPHGPDAEFYYMLRGRLAVTDNGVETYLNEGDAMFTGNGESHSVRNDGEQPAVLMAIVLP